MIQEQTPTPVAPEPEPSPIPVPPVEPTAPLSGRQWRWRNIGLVLALVMTGAAVGVAILSGAIPYSVHGSGHPTVEPQEKIASLARVKVIHPREENSVEIEVSQLASVEPYYKADLRARASGIVKQVTRDIGDPVKQGELLVEIDSPELVQDVARSEAMVLQREQELRVSQAKLKDAESARLVSVATIKQREADVQGTIATRDLKKRKFQRFKELAERGTVVGSLVEEEERDYLTSEATLLSARANVDRARADLAESESRVEAALADIELKKAQIEVARKELDRARAVADFAKLVAPFDGVVVKRSVDPGSFVQNATTGTSEPLISLARVDIVTVTARFPDNIAPSIFVGTPADVVIEDLPGVTIEATVSRIAPSVMNADRTMRVEIDLFNGNQQEYEQFVQAIKGGKRTRPVKGMRDTLPVHTFSGQTPTLQRLLPGMTATMKLAIGSFGKSYVLPKTAVYSRSGTTYMLLVQNGITRQIPVRVQFDDGKTVRVSVASRKQGASGKVHDVFVDLTGKEEVVVARQLEIGDGAQVQANLSQW